MPASVWCRRHASTMNLGLDKTESCMDDRRNHCDVTLLYRVWKVRFGRSNRNASSNCATGKSIFRGCTAVTLTHRNSFSCRPYNFQSCRTPNSSCLPVLIHVMKPGSHHASHHRVVIIMMMTTFPFPPTHPPPHPRNSKCSSEIQPPKSWTESRENLRDNPHISMVISSIVSISIPPDPENPEKFEKKT